MKQQIKHWVIRTSLDVIFVMKGTRTKVKAKAKKVNRDILEHNFKGIEVTDELASIFHMDEIKIMDLTK